MKTMIISAILALGLVELAIFSGILKVKGIGFRFILAGLLLSLVVLVIKTLK